MEPNEKRKFADLVPQPRVQDIYATDEVPPPAGLRNESSDDLSTDDLSVERYFSYEWHRQEVEHVWKKTWQFACREE